MAAMLATKRLGACTKSSTACKAPAHRRAFACRSFDMLLAEAGVRTGEVEAPIGVAVAAAVIVSIAITAAVPLYLNRGQEAADELFDASRKDNRPLDKMPKATVRKVSKYRKPPTSD